MRAQDSATPPSSIAVAEPATTPRTASATTPNAASPANTARTAIRSSARDATGSASASRPTAPGPSAGRGGTVLAGLGVVAFSLTFPGTAWGLESFGPWSLVALRSVLAALIAGAMLLAGRG
ncbi:EamA family transporter, partial [Streptomyces griseus]